MVKTKKDKFSPKVLKAWWSEKYVGLGKKVTLHALIESAIGQTIVFQIYEFRRKNKILKEIYTPVHYAEVNVKWEVACKPEVVEYGNPEFRFIAKIGKSSKTSKTLYIPAELKIALTFDDGPAFKEKPTTERVLKILKKKNIRATFFVEHSRIHSEYGQSILKWMVKDGHEVGVHGVDPIKHHLKHQDTLNFKAKLKSMKELIRSTIGAYPKLIRPPGGWGKWEKGELFNKPQLRRIYQESNVIRVNGWKAEIGRTDFWINIDSIIEAASKGNTQKLIILSHDLRDYDAANLSNIVDRISKKAKEVKVKVEFVGISALE